MNQPATGFTEVARDVYMLRYPLLSDSGRSRGASDAAGMTVNVTLVLGDGEALLVDTLSTDAQARQLADAARALTPYPWTIVNTHHHFDHCFGNDVLSGDLPIWGHEEAAAQLSRHAEALRRTWFLEWEPTDPELAAGLAAVRVVPPTHTVHRAAALDIGGRPVLLRHLGRGHTAGDLVVEVPDAGVVIAGDLVEQGTPPSFEDAYPLEWPETVSGLLHLLGTATTVVPGHGRTVDREFVAGQHQALTALEWRIREGHGDGAPVEAVARATAAELSWPEEVTRTAVRRGYAELSGRAG